MQALPTQAGSGKRGLFARATAYASLCVLLLAVASWSGSAHAANTSPPPPPPPGPGSVEPGAVPAATVGQYYSQTFSAEGPGGKLPFTYAVSSGALPDGLALAGDGSVGILSGTPREDGAFGFTITVSDAHGMQASRGYTLAVGAPSLSISPGSLPPATAGTVVNTQISASGGTASYGYAVGSGTLPPGVGLDSGSGRLSGTPTFQGTYHFTLTATDSTGGNGPYSASRAYAWVIAAPALSFAPASLPHARVGAAVNTTLSASGGSAPYSYQVAAGSLPPGVGLGASGTLSGVPTAGGSFGFTVRATDSSGGSGPYTTSRAYTWVVDPATIMQTVTALLPVRIGDPYDTTLLPSTGGTPPYHYSVDFGLPPGIALSDSGTFSGAPPDGTSTGTYAFDVTATDSSTGTGPYGSTLHYTIVVHPRLAVAHPVSATVAFDSTDNAIAVVTSGGPVDDLFISDHPDHGTATRYLSGFRYTPDTGFSGTDSFAYLANNDGGNSAPASVTITVLPAVPVANPVSASVAYGSGVNPVVLNITGGTPASVAIGSPASHGTAAVGPGGASITYQPDAGYSGSDSFTYVASSASGASAPATVSITVGAPTLALAPAAGTLAFDYGAASSQAFTASGGAGPYGYVLTGSLPTGLVFDSSSGALSGTPAQTGSFPIAVTASDSSTGASAPFSVTGNYILQINDVAIAITPSGLAGGTSGVVYAHAFAASGGIGPYTFGIVAGALPTGMSLAANGSLSGTPTATGTATFTVQAQDANGHVGTRGYDLAVSPATLILSPGSLHAATGGATYLQTFAASGGVAPYHYAIVAGSLPTGLALNATIGALSGTPTVGGTFNFNVQASDSSGGTVATVTRSYAIVVNAPAIALIPATAGAGHIGVPYSVVIGASGGTAPYAFMVTGAFPAGMSFDPGTATVSGTPTEAGSFPLQVTVTDANGFTGVFNVTPTVSGATLVIDPASLPSATAETAYSQAINASGGTAPYAYSLAGTLPAGLAFDVATGVLSGTPTASGDFAFSVTASDNSTGAGAPFTATQDYMLHVAAPTIDMAPTALPDTPAFAAYFQTFTANGGQAPYTFALTGSLPAGVSFNAATATLSGIPSEAGNFPLTVTATDAHGFQGIADYNLGVGVATLTIGPATLLPAVAGTAYSATMTGSGGAPPYSYAAITPLPDGLVLGTTGVLSGTPTDSGHFSFSVIVSDSSVGAGAPFHGARRYRLHVAAPVIAVIPTPSGTGRVGDPYSVVLGVSGGVAPYVVAVTGTLPAGMGFDAASATISGTPTQAGGFPLQVTATDANGFAGIYNITAQVTAATVAIAPGSLPGAVAGNAYGQPITTTGGTAPYSHAITGTLPPGIAFDTATGMLSGTPTTTGDFAFSVTAVDSSSGTGAPFTATQFYTLEVAAPAISVGPAALAGADVGSPYNEVLTASGGHGPYMFELTGNLPAGVTFDAATATLSGTPTQAGSFPLTITATGADGFEGSASTSLAVGAAVVAIAPATLAPAEGGTAYSQAIIASGGTAPYSYAVTGALPAGIVFDAASGLLSGMPTAGGDFAFNITASDSSTGAGTPFTATQAYTLHVEAPTIAVAPVMLAAAGIGSPWSQVFSASGGSGPYTFELTGSLPTGLAFDTATATLSGTPTQAGNFPLAVTVTDAHGFEGSASYSLAVTAGTVTIAPAISPPAIAGTAYAQAFSASGGTAPYELALTGTLPAGIVFDAATGLLSGVPTTSGDFGFDIIASDSSTGPGTPSTASRAYTLHVESPTIAITPATIPGGAVATAYPATTLAATGGVGPYTFVLASALPAGMDFDAATATVSGSPTESGTFPLQVTATDANGFQGTAGYSLVVDAAMVAIAPSTLPPAQAEAAYSQAIGASGGTAPYSYAISGALPAGIGFDAATGMFSGTPTAGGDFDFSITAHDSSTGADAPFTATHHYTLHVEAPTIAVAPVTLAAAAIGSPWSQVFSADGGSGPYTFVLSGSLPAGLAFDPATATLSGTPSQAGNFPLTVAATDAHGFQGSAGYNLVVAASMVTIVPAASLPARVGTAYSQTFSAGGGTAPYSLALTGTLPAGMAFDPATGVLSGTPTANGNFDFSITASDSSSGPGAPFTASLDYMLAVAEPAIVLSPTSLPATAKAGVAYPATALSAVGGAPPYAFHVATGTLPPGMVLTTAGVLQGTPDTAGDYTFMVEAVDNSGYGGTRDYAIAVAAATPVAVADSATVVAGQAVTIEVTDNDEGPIDSIAISAAPDHGSASVDGLQVAYSPAPGFFGQDAFSYIASGPGGTSPAAEVTITVQPLPVPEGIDQEATVLAGESVTIDASAGASGGPFTGVTIVDAPETGTVVVEETDLVYTADAAFSGQAVIGYTLDNSYGSSALLHATITVNPLPVAMSRSIEAVAGAAVLVDLVEGASGGPFIAADVVSVSPVDAGIAKIDAIGDAGFQLEFTPDIAFSGLAVVGFTLSNAYAVSAPGEIRIQVAPRNDPSQDAEVTGLLAAQVASTRRFATAQISNFQQRLEHLHDGRGGQGGFSNGLSLATTNPCNRVRVAAGSGCPSEALHDEQAPVEAPATATATSSLPPILGIWTGGAITFGSREDQLADAGFEYRTSGISLGADYRVDDAFAFGAGIGYGHDDSDVGENGSRSEADAYNLALYASYHPHGTFYLDGLAGYQWLSFDMRRFVTETGGLVYGSRDGEQWFASLSAGYDYRRDTLLVSPYARFDAASARLDGYIEQGDPFYSLGFAPQDVETRTVSLGVRMDYLQQLDADATLAPQLRLEYQHDLHDDSTAIINFADLVSGPFFRSDVPGFDRNRLIFGIGGAWQSGNGTTLRLEYRQLFGSEDRTDRSLLFNLEKQY